MTDRITQCDVVDCCEDCPRYADDCDGDKYLDRYPTMHEYAEGKRVNPKLTDLISRADVLKYPIRLDHYDEEHGNRDFVLGIESVMEYVESLPSADAVPQLRQTDTLIIADALRYLAQDTERHLVDRTRADALRQQFLKYGASMCKGGDDE